MSLIPLVGRRCCRFGRCLILLGLCLALFEREADARDDSADLTRICRQLIGHPLFSPEWDQLTPYLRRKDALANLQVTCGQNCSGALPLRDGFEIRFSFPKIDNEISLAGRDAEIDAVKLLKKGQVVFQSP